MQYVNNDGQLVDINGNRFADSRGNIILAGEHPRPATRREPQAVEIEIVGDVDERMANRVVAKIKAAGNRDLRLVISSLGGEVDAEQRIIEALETHSGRIYGHVVEWAFSAAAMILLACDIRSAEPDAQIALHDASLDGCLSETREVNEAAARFITERCPRISMATAQSWLDHRGGEGIYLNQADALKWGILNQRHLHAGKTMPTIAASHRAFAATCYKQADCTCSDCVRKRASTSTIIQPAAKRLQPINLAVPEAVQTLLKQGAGALGMSFRNSSGPNDPAEISIFGEIGNPADGADASTVNRFLRQNHDRRVKVKINSLGGHVFEGIAAFNALAAHRPGVTVEIESMAGSAASIIAMAGNPILIHQNAEFFIHRAAIGTYGNVDVLRENIAWLNKIDQSLAETYAARTGRPVSQMLQLMRGEEDGTVMTAREAVAGRFADKIIPTPPRNAATTTSASSDAEVRREARLARNRVAAFL
jgi:ATP-dependent protease ClpP protease subunit